MFIKASISAFLWKLSQAVTVTGPPASVWTSKPAVEGQSYDFDVCSLYTISNVNTGPPVFYFDTLSCSPWVANILTSSAYLYANQKTYPCSGVYIRISYPLGSSGTQYSCTINFQGGSLNDGYAQFLVNTSFPTVMSSAQYNQRCYTLGANNCGIGTVNYDFAQGSINLGTSLYNFGSWASPVADGALCTPGTYSFVEGTTSVTGILTATSQTTTAAHKRVDISLQTSDTTLNGLTKTYALQATINSGTPPTTTYPLCTFSVRYGCVVSPPTTSAQNYRIGEPEKRIPHITSLNTYGTTCTFGSSPFSLTYGTGTPTSLIGVDDTHYIVYQTQDWALKGVYTVVLWITDQHGTQHQLETLTVTFLHPCEYQNDAQPPLAQTFILAQPSFIFETRPVTGLDSKMDMLQQNFFWESTKLNDGLLGIPRCPCNFKITFGHNLIALNTLYQVISAPRYITLQSPPLVDPSFPIYSTISVTVTMDAYPSITKTFSIPANIYICEVPVPSQLSVKYLIGSSSMLVTHITKTQVEAIDNDQCVFQTNPFSIDEGGTTPTWVSVNPAGPDYTIPRTTDLSLTGVHTAALKLSDMSSIDVIGETLSVDFVNPCTSQTTNGLAQVINKTSLTTPVFEVERVLSFQPAVYAFNDNDFSLQIPTPTDVSCGPWLYTISCTNCNSDGSNDVTFSLDTFSSPRSLTLNVPTTPLSTTITGTVSLSVKLLNYPQISGVFTNPFIVWTCEITPTASTISDSYKIGDPNKLLAHFPLGSILTNGHCHFLMNPFSVYSGAQVASWVTVDNSDYTIVQTTDLLQQGTHNAVLKIEDASGLLIDLETISVNFLNPCLFQDDQGKPQQVLRTKNSKFETKAFVGPTYVFSWVDGDFPLETPPHSAITCGPNDYTLTVTDTNLIAQAIFILDKSTATRSITVKAPKVLSPNVDIISQVQLDVSLAGYIAVKTSYLFDTVILACCLLTQTTTFFDQRTIYLGQKETAMPHFDISKLQYTGNCFVPLVVVYNDKLDGAIFDPSSTWLSTAGLMYTFKSTQNLMDLGQHDVAFEIYNSDLNQLVTIESFQANILDPCVHATINPQKLPDFRVVVGTAQTKKISPWTFKHRSEDGLPLESNYACGALKMELEFRDASFHNLVNLNADELKIDTTNLQNTFYLTFLTNSSHQACVKVSMPAYAKTVHSRKDCFTMFYTKASTLSSHSVIQTNPVITSGQNKHNPFSENTPQPIVSSCRPLSVASVIFTCGDEGNLNINWQAIQDLGLFGSSVQVAFDVSSVLEPGVTRSIVVDLDLPAEFKQLDETISVEFAQVTLENVHEIFEEMQEQLANSENNQNEQIAGKLVGNSAGLSEAVAKMDFDNEDSFFYKNGHGLPDFNDTDESSMKARIEYVSTNGTLSAQFNQRIVFPHWFIDVVNFFANEGQLQEMTEVQRHLQICEEPCPQGSIKQSHEVLGFIEKFKEKPLLELGIYIRQYEHPEHSNEELLRYQWKVVRVNNETATFYIKLDFEHPLEFSATSEPEFVKLDFNYPAYFKSISGNVLETEYAIKRIPQQVSDPVKCDRLKKLGTAAADILTVAFSGSLIVNYFLLVSLSLLWNLLNSVQYVVFLPLAEVNYPANAMMLNSVLLKIANFDIIPCVKILQKIFTFGPQQPFSRSHENFGNDSHAMMLNMGTTGMIFLLSLTILPLCQIGFYYLDKHYGGHYDGIRRAYAKIKPQSHYAYYFRMFLEVYLDIAIGAFVNLYDINRIFSSKDYFSGDIVSSLLAVFTMILISVVPLYLWTVLVLNRDKLTEQDFDSKYGELTHQYRSKRYYSSVIFMFRRLLTALILVCLRGYSFFQIIFLSYLQTAYIMFISLAKPADQRIVNQRELQTEILTMFCIYHLFFFTDWVASISATAAYNCGWTQCILIGIIILSALFQILRDTIKTIKRKLFLTELTRLRKLAAQHGIKIQLSADREANQKQAQHDEKEANNELQLRNDSELQLQVDGDESQLQHEQAGVQQAFSNPQLISAKIKNFHTRNHSKEQFNSIQPTTEIVSTSNQPIGIDVLQQRFGTSQLAMKIMSDQQDSNQLESFNDEEEMKVVNNESCYKRDQKGSPIRPSEQTNNLSLRNIIGQPQPSVADIHCLNDIIKDYSGSSNPFDHKRAKPLWQVRIETTLDKLKQRTVIDIPELSKDNEKI